MLKNAIIYRIPKTWTMPAGAAVEEALDSARFVPCGPTQTESSGWVEPRGEKHGALLECVGGHSIFKLCTETRSVPASAVKTKLDEKLALILQETGRKPGGQRKKELKEEIIQELLPRAFTKTATTTVWLNPRDGFLVVGAGSVGKADKVVTALVELLTVAGDGITVSGVDTHTSPSTAMSAWLATREAPYNFTVDRECELKLPDSERSTVRYSRHTLDIDEVVRHIQQGKQATQLALTWDGRVSFVLTDAMLVKKIDFLDVVVDEHSKDGDGKGDTFDADVAIATGELSKLIPDLIEALGGERTVDAAPTAPAAAVVSAEPSQEAPSKAEMAVEA